MQILLIYFLFSYSQFFGVKDCKKEKKNASYNQCLLSVTKEVSSNVNNKFCSNLVQNVNFNHPFRCIYGSIKVSQNK